jgi:perosamine synthetase
VLGSFGDVAILSFGRGKGMTGGSGGALLVRSRELAGWTSQMRAELGAGSGGGLQVMRLAAQSILARPSVYRLPASIPGLRLGEMVYRAPAEARPMAAAAAAILHSAIKTDDREVQRRRARAQILVSRINHSQEVVPVHSVVGGDSGFLRFALLDAGGSKVPRPTIGAVRGYPMTLDQHPQLQPVLMPGESAGKGSQMLRDSLFTLPTHSRVNTADLNRLEEWLV